MKNDRSLQPCNGADALLEGEGDGRWLFFPLRSCQHPSTELSVSARVGGLAAGRAKSTPSPAHRHRGTAWAPWACGVPMLMSGCIWIWGKGIWSECWAGHGVTHLMGGSTHCNPLGDTGALAAAWLCSTTHTQRASLLLLPEANFPVDSN